MPKNLSEWLQDVERFTWGNAAKQSVTKLQEFGDKIGAVPKVVSAHTSKSIQLPVVEYQMQRDGEPTARLIVRDNFHDIKVSLWAPKAIDHDLWGIPAFCSTRDLSTCYFEGFAKEWVLPSFFRGTKKFSCSLGLESFQGLAEVLTCLYNDGEKHEYRYEHYRKEQIRRRQALDYGLPCVVSKGNAVSGFFRFFSYPLAVNEAVLDYVLTYTENGYKPQTKKLPYLNIDFTSGCPEPVDDWLKAIARVVARQKKDPEVSRLGNDVGISVQFTGMTPDLVETIRRLDLQGVFKNSKE
jgi:hypothetical protein